MRRRLAEAGYAAVCVASAVALTWPLVTVFTTRLGGDAGDPFQTLWTMRLMRDALFSFQNPFFTVRAHHPHGATLVFQTFDIPSAVLVAPLWDLVPEVTVYNTAVLFAFALTAYGMFRLARELTGDPFCALLAGILFSAVPYHLAHLKGHLHLTSMGWVPLYLVHLLRMIRGSATRRDALLAGLFLALASLASWYHLLFALVVTLVLLVHGAIANRDALCSTRFVRAALMLAATYLVTAGPLLVAILVIRAREEITGAHDPVVFSADLYAFVFPNGAQSWARDYGAHFLRWSGNTEENAAYVGLTMLALALLGGATHGLARAFLVAAILGVVLALGPYLHVDGNVLATRMPYWYLEALLPPLAFMGVPVRFGYVMYLGLTAAAAFGLARLRKLFAFAPVAIGIVAVLVPFCLALYEYRPRALVTWAYPTPAPLRAWARDPASWAVLDVSDDFRQLWHATIHRKPMVGGYLSRVPKRLDDWLHRQPIISAIEWPGQPLRIERVDPKIDFAWGTASPDPALAGDGFAVQWSGTMLAPTGGRYQFWLTADDAAILWIDRRWIAGRRDGCGGQRPCEATGEVDLTAGPHALALAFVEVRDDAEVHLAWQPPGGVRQIVPTEALRTAGGRPGLTGTYEQPGRAVSGLGREGGRAWLRALGIRYVITGDGDNACVERELELPRVYTGEGVRIYEVPPG